MEGGLRLGCTVFIRPGFDGLLFVSIALVVAEAFVNFDHGKSISHEANFAAGPEWSLNVMLCYWPKK
jgi:hypothetical protein